MQSSNSPDTFARMLNWMGDFRGKARLADSLGRISTFWNDGRGVFPIYDGKTIAVDLNDRIQRLMWGGAYEPRVRKCLVALLRPGDVFVDIGAHIGFFSLIASCLVGPNGKVYAFEANPNLFRTLQTNTAKYPWIVPTPRAVWKEGGLVSFSDPQQPGETGWGKLTAIRNEGLVLTVEAITLDDWHVSVDSTPIRAIKIDAEGSEPFILEGARRMIARSRPMLIIELNDKLLCESGKSREVVVATLREQNYSVFAIESAKSKRTAGSNAIVSPEVLCMPSEQIAETREILDKLGIDKLG